MRVPRFRSMRGDWRISGRPCPTFKPASLPPTALQNHYRRLGTDLDKLKPVGEDRIGVVVRGSGPGNGEVPCDLILHARSELEE